MKAGSRAVLLRPGIRLRGRKNSSSVPADYDHYRFSLSEVFRFSLPPFLAALLVSFVFYGSIFVFPFFFVPALILFFKRTRKNKIEKRKEELKREFLTAATLLGDYLRSGYSVENALIRSERELIAVHGADCDMAKEWRRMAEGLKLNRTVEEVFRDFSKRAGISEIRDFAEIFGIVKRGNGQLGEVISAVTAQLSEQFRAEEQITSMLASKRLELRIMDVVPMFILLYIRLVSPDLLTVMYESFAGRIVMTACLGVYLFAIFLAEKILKL